MNNVNYLEMARNDSTWREVVASMQISGFDIDASLETLVGLRISGELTFASLVDIVTSPFTGGGSSSIATLPSATLSEQGVGSG